MIEKTTLRAHSSGSPSQTLKALECKNFNFYQKLDLIIKKATCLIKKLQKSKIKSKKKFSSTAIY
jgi:hypothetical protein